MGALTIVLLFLLGLALTIKGGDFFVDAASWIAEVSGIPKFLIGATIVSLATTLPELLVSAGMSEALTSTICSRSDAISRAQYAVQTLLVLAGMRTTSAL